MLGLSFRYKNNTLGLIFLKNRYYYITFQIAFCIYKTIKTIELYLAILNKNFSIRSKRMEEI